MFKKKIQRKLSGTLCLLLLFTLAAGAFPFARAEASSAFSDVPSGSYYYTEVTAMADQGIVSGFGNGQFQPASPVTNAQAAKLVCGMAGINTSGYTGYSSPWYIDVWTWAQDNGIVPAGTQPEAAATREQICGYIAAAYKLDTTSTRTDAFSDTDSRAANTLYDYGVVKGIDNGDGTFSFGGSQNVKRCDTCIMLYRLSSQVQKPSWPAITPKTPVQTFSLDKSHYVVSKPASLSSYSDYVQAWNYMLVNKVLSASFTLPSNYSDSQLQNVMDTIQDAYNYSAFDYMEYAAFLNGWGVNSRYQVRSGRYYNVTVTLQLKNAAGSSRTSDLSNSAVLSEISTFEQTCDNIVTGLYQDGSLTTGMSVKEKAHVLYRYMALHTQYDNSYRYYNGYDAAVRHTAVCQGYTSMYNYLCNIAGVPMEAMTGELADGGGHAWSRIYQNGTYYNVDSTWGDPVPDKAGYCDEDWFWVSDNYLKTCDDPRTFDIDSMSQAA